jgi:p-hydroxybenzoate 3-monooxygenase
VEERTQVAIVGAGPAGLVLGRLLEGAGIDSVVLEARSRSYIEQRVRAGVLEQGTVELLRDLGVGDRLAREGLVHHGIELRFDRRGHRIPFDELTGGRITIYGQQEVVKDLIAARLESGLPLLFEAEAVSVDRIDSARPIVHYSHEGQEQSIGCDFVAGCDGFHGVCREAVPAGVLRHFSRHYPFGWLGILAEVPPSTEELIYAYNDRGFALHSLRSPELSRLYVQCGSEDKLDDWPDERVWEELHLRLARDDGWSLSEGPVIEKSIAELRSFVAEPMQHGRLYLAGDAVHIVPATGAKGLNLAVADVRTLAAGLDSYYRSGDERLLQDYSRICLDRVWRAQHFAWWMTDMLHRFDDEESGFRARLQRAQLHYVTTSRAAATTLAENYVGFQSFPTARRPGLNGSVESFT